MFSPSFSFGITFDVCHSQGANPWPKRFVKILALRQNICVKLSFSSFHLVFTSPITDFYNK